MDWANTTAQRIEKHLNFLIWWTYTRGLPVVAACSSDPILSKACSSLVLGCSNGSQWSHYGGSWRYLLSNNWFNKPWLIWDAQKGWKSSGQLGLEIISWLGSRLWYLQCISNEISSSNWMLMKYDTLHYWPLVLTTLRPGQDGHRFSKRHFQFPWTKIFELHVRFHWNMLLGV